MPYPGLLKSYSVSSFFSHRAPNLQADGSVRAERSKHLITLTKTADTGWKCSIQKNIFFHRLRNASSSYLPLAFWVVCMIIGYLPSFYLSIIDLLGLSHYCHSLSLLQLTACGQQLKAISDICLGKSIRQKCLLLKNTGFVLGISKEGA